MTESDAEKYRAWAAQCLSMAQRAQREDDKAVWLELAAKWQRLSQGAGPRPQQAEQPQPKDTACGGGSGVADCG